MTTNAANDDGQIAGRALTEPSARPGGLNVVRQSIDWLRAGGDDPVSIQPIVRTGLAIVIGFFFILGGWAAFAPLNSAILAPGTVIVENRRKTIDHLEGGIVSELLVREGAMVKAGDVLMRLRDSRVRSEVGMLKGRDVSLLALEARLRAEQSGARKLVFAPELLERAQTPEAREAIEGQTRLFNSNRSSLDEQLKILGSQIDQGRELIGGLKQQIASVEEQSRLIAIELADVTELYEKGFERKSRVNALKRAAAQLDGQQGGLLAEVQRTEQSNAERLQRMSSLRADFVTKAATELRKVEEDLYDVNQQLTAGRDREDRLEVRAPVSGRVVSLRVNTIGEVIQPAEPLMEIVPDADRLIIEARLTPLDIDNVKIGMPARVHFTGLSYLTNHPVPGVLRMLSADALHDQQSNMSFFLARVEVDANVAKDLKLAHLLPGMPAEVMITTRKRTVLQYIFEPLYRSVVSSFNQE